MKRLTFLLILILSIFGFSGNLLAQDNGIIADDELAPEEVAQAVEVRFTDISGNPITSIQSGNPVWVHASHPSVSPLKGTCILVLPVNSPNYKETGLFSRQYTGSGVVGESYPFYIPSWIQIEGYAIALVTVEGAGVGWGVLQVTK